ALARAVTWLGGDESADDADHAVPLRSAPRETGALLGSLGVSPNHRSVSLRRGRLSQRRVPRELADDRLLGRRYSDLRPSGEAPSAGGRARVEPVHDLLAADRGAASRRRSGVASLAVAGGSARDERRARHGPLHPGGPTYASFG